MLDKYPVAHAYCNMCSGEYIDAESKKLIELPLNQRRAAKIESILNEARKESGNVCAMFNIQGHVFAICENHLQKMIDSIKEYR